MKCTKKIDYDHNKNTHSIAGAKAVIMPLMEMLKTPASLLDVGCGTGCWMRAALDLGMNDVIGIEGAAMKNATIHVPSSLIIRHDLRKPFDLKRKFDLVICLEVAEHIQSSSAKELITSLALHSDQILFSAAIPCQIGQGHINCQWPAFWQTLFNNAGFSCSDSPRWMIWSDQCAEPWYRQNLILAKRDSYAGKEPRIKAVIHPEMIELISLPGQQSRDSQIEAIEGGSMSLAWYFTVPIKGAIGKLKRKCAAIKFSTDAKGRRA